MNQDSFRQMIENEFILRKRRNNSYSLRAFASQLGIDPGYLSRFINGERSLSLKKMKVLALRLGLSEVQIDKEVKKSDYRLLEKEELNVTTHWYYLAILECIHLDDFEANPNWIANKLKLPTNVIKIAINKMLRAGYLSIDDNGQWIDCYETISTQSSENVDELILREFQKQVLDLAKESIDNNKAEEKSHTAHIVSVDEATMTLAKEEIKKFRRKLAKICKQKSKSKEKVYCLQINFFEYKKSGR